MSKPSNQNDKKKKREAKLKKRTEEKKLSGGTASQASLTTQVKILENRITHISEALSKNLQKFTEAFAQNLQIIRQSFYVTDTHLGVLQRVCQDLAGGRVKLTDEALKFNEANPTAIYEGPNLIDFVWYYKQFEEERKKAMEAAKEAEAAKAPGATQEPVMVPATIPVTVPNDGDQKTSDGVPSPT